MLILFPEIALVPVVKPAVNALNKIPSAVHEKIAFPEIATFTPSTTLIPWLFEPLIVFPVIDTLPVATVFSILIPATSELIMLFPVITMFLFSKASVANSVTLMPCSLF